MSKELADYQKMPLDKQKRIGRYVWGFCGLFFLWIIVAFWTEYSNCQQAEVQNRKFDNLIVLISQNSNVEDKMAIVVQHFKDYYEIDESTAEKRVEELIKSKKQRIEQQQSLTEREKEIEKEFALKWVPFIEVILEEFDANIEAYNKQGVRVELEKANSPDYIETGKTTSSNTMLRKATFPHGTYIAIVSSPAHIWEGKLLGFLVIHFEDTKTPSGAFQLVFRKEMVMFSEIGKSGTETHDAPINDPKFVSVVRDAIVRLIDRVYIDDFQRSKD